jgi:hypothetical protein
MNHPLWRGIGIRAVHARRNSTWPMESCSPCVTPTAPTTTCSTTTASCTTTIPQARLRAPLCTFRRASLSLSHLSDHGPPWVGPKSRESLRLCNENELPRACVELHVRGTPAGADADLTGVRLRKHLQEPMLGEREVVGRRFAELAAAVRCGDAVSRDLARGV